MSFNKRLPLETPSDPNFGIVLYTGDGGTQAITGVGFKPDLVWAKKRSGADDNVLFDSTRGVQKEIISNSAAAQATKDEAIESFDADGFTTGANGALNASGGTYVSWSWKANGGTTSTNNDGSQASTVQANDDAGFSIVKWTGNGSAAKTLGHGLSSAPKMVIVKKLGASQDWWVYHNNVDGSAPARYWVSLNKDDARGDNGASGGSLFNSTSPTSSVFSTGTTLQESSDYIAYCFADVDGYSSLGGYTGATGGKSITTGFQPDFIMVKSTSNVENWAILDSSRGTGKVTNPNRNNAEGSSNLNTFTVSSTGFAFPHQNVADAMLNENNYTYIYAAFKINP